MLSNRCADDEMTNSMAPGRRCIVDNWSLECAALVVSDGIRAIRAGEAALDLRDLGDHIAAGTSSPPPLLPETRLGTPESCVVSLANVLTTMVLFDGLSYIGNGFEQSWQRYTDFSSCLGNVLTRLPADDEDVNDFYGDVVLGGLRFYLHMAQLHDTDVIMNPRRSTLMSQNLRLNNPAYSDYVEDLLSVLDEEVKKKLLHSPSRLLKAHAFPNLSLPPVFHFVLSNASSKGDVLRVAHQVRDLKPCAKLRSVIQSISTATCEDGAYASLVDEVRSLTSDLHREVSSGRRSGSIGASLFGLLTFSWNIEKMLRPTDHRVFLRDLIRCRMDISKNRDLISRVLA